LLVEPHDNCSVGKPTIQDSTAELQPPKTSNNNIPHAS
jgi:hypothetical protein